MNRPLIRLLALSSIAALYSLCPNPSVPSAAADPPPSLPFGYVLVWGDEFHGPALDTLNNWAYYQPGYVRRDAIDTRDAVSIVNDKLVLRSYTHVTNPPGPTPFWTSMVVSGGSNPGACAIPDEMAPPGNKHMPRYGYIEASIDFDGQSGMWHSFFVQTPNNLLHGPLDEHLRGMEMDIVEHKVTHGSAIPPPDDSQKAPSALHWMTGTSQSICSPDTFTFLHAGTGEPGNGNALGVGFHTYGLEWTPDFLKFYYDNNLVWTVVDPTYPCPPGQTCAVAPISHVPELITLCPEVPAANQGSIDAYGPRAASFGENGDDVCNPECNPKMTVEYVHHYQLLAAPTGLTATAVSTAQINLAWTDKTYAEDGFKIERSTNNVNFTEIASVPGSNVNDATITYQDIAVNADTRYYYRVRAYIGALHSPYYSNTASAITDLMAPGVISNLSVPNPAGIGKRNLRVTWTAPGDDGTGQPVTQYDLRYSTSLITAANFASATPLTTSAPHNAGYPECVVASNLSQCTFYYFAIKSKDEWGNWSAISNVPNPKTACQGNPSAQCVPPPTDATAPASVNNLLVTSFGKLNLAVSWTAPGDDANSGTASEYDFRYSGAPITAGNFNSATRFPISAPAVAGSAECRLVQWLSACTMYYFALKTKDEAGNWSAMSNVTNHTTECSDMLAVCGQGGGVAKLAVANDEAPRMFSSPSPNPARGATSFRISIPDHAQGAKLRVGVFDVQGRQVRSLVDRTASSGSAQIDWNLLDDSGRRVASGLYMIRVDVADTRKTFRLVVVR